MIKFISAIVHNSIKSIFVFSLISFLICLAVFIVNYPQTFSVFELIWFPLGVLLCYFGVKLSGWLENKSEKFTILFLSALSIAAYLIVLLTYNTKPVSDYKVVWDTAVVMANGNYNVAAVGKGSYMDIYNWQIGIAAFESLVIRVFGENFTYLKILSCLCGLAISYLLYRVAKTKFDLKTAKTVYVLSVIFLPYIMTVGQFSNHHIGTVLLLLSLYCLDKDKYVYSGIGGVLAAMLNVCRAIAVLIIIAAVFMFIYKVIKERKFLKPISHLVIIIGCFWAATFSFNQAFILAGYADQALTTPKIPYFKFDKGLTGYDQPFGDVKKFGGDLSKFNDWEQQKVEDAIEKTPAKTTIYVVNKMCRYLGLMDYQFEHTYDHDNAVWEKYPIKTFYTIGWMQYIVYVLLALIGYSWWSRKNPLDIYQIWFIGNTLVYLFIEAFSSYRFEHYIFIFLMAGCGCSLLSDKKLTFHKFRIGFAEKN